MPLSVGARVGPYEIASAIGAGGMGEVYRARDARLGRDVAIKALPDRFSADPERVTRFRREAQILASLNHPNIAGIYGLEEVDGSRFLILELVEGRTLADRLKEGPLSLSEMLTMARQIADALHAAHDKGIIHRDLKPANIALNPDGQVKILDFGLAKAIEPAADSPTMMPDATEAGVMLGTAAYMSPEQAQGKPLDKRTDIWAFGCVLFEMLARHRPFAGQTTSETIAAVLHDAPDWTALPAALPARIPWLLRRCLEKDPRRRLHDVADARIELDEAVNEPPGSNRVVLAPRNTRELVAWAVAGASLVALTIAVMIGRRAEPDDAPADVRAYNASINIPDGLRPWAGNPPGRFALSPDGRRLALIAANASGQTMVWIRPLDTHVAQPLAGTEGATFPFWSPDSRFIAFLAGGKLKRIDVSGGPPITLSDATIGCTGAWNTDNVILFTPKGSSPLYRVSASGGPPTPATKLDAAAGDVQHWYPAFLPDGRHFVYFVVGSKTRGVTDPRAVYIGSLDPAEPARLLVEGGSNAKYANGHLVYLRDGTLVAHAFDLERLELRGQPVPLVEQVQIAGTGTTGVAGAFSVSDTGVLAYQAGFLVRSQLAWFDRTGRQIGKLGDAADYADVSLSPDDTRAAVSVMDPLLGSRDVWIYETARGTRERFTFDPGDDFAPIWSRPYGDRIAFSSRREGGIHLYQKRARGGSNEELLLQDGLGKFASHWSFDGQFIIYVGGGGIIVRSDLWVLPLAGRKAYPFIETAFIESQGQFSPDGRWIAYMSNESGQSEVYVRSFDGAGNKWLVSTAGGRWPRWRADGREIFYLAPDNTLVAVPIDAREPAVAVRTGRPLFNARIRPMVRLDAFPYDVTADGQRFLVNTFVEDPISPAITLVVNWPGLVKK